MVDAPARPLCVCTPRRSRPDCPIRLLEHPSDARWDSSNRPTLATLDRLGARSMSRFKNEVTHLQSHVRTLRLATGALFVLGLVLAFGWWRAPHDLVVHVP